jgi:hypothetical protein
MGQNDPGVRTPVGDRSFFSLHIFQTEFGAHTASYTVRTGPPSLEKKKDRGAALTIHPLPALTFRMSTAYLTPLFTSYGTLWGAL